MTEQLEYIIDIEIEKVLEVIETQMGGLSAGDDEKIRAVLVAFWDAACETSE